ncbi:MAG: ClpX C4-type zinc finger [Acidobacteriaceae bacterium]|jgi:ATP-dependent protease Clp ATPase subunit|nr:ClpX C4-type zinc finger [Acidobacteriaceae bacterium]
MNEARCSFCDRSADDVKALIKAPAGDAEVYICTDCVRACATTLNKSGLETPQVARDSKPARGDSAREPNKKTE